MLYMMPLVSLALLFLFAVQGIGQDLISPEQAIDAVRAFEGDPKLEVKVVELEHETDAPAWSPLSIYRLQAQKSHTDERDFWYVNAQTGEVIGVNYGGTTTDDSEEPFGPLTKEECRQIAENFARSKYAGFDEMNFELDTEYWRFIGWEFEWRQRLAYGAWGVNFVGVEVNPADGRIQSYSAVRVRQIRPPREPKITAEQAIEIAKQAIKLVIVEGVTEPELTADPYGNVFWEFAIGGENVSGYYREAAVTINAETGEVKSIAYACIEPIQRLSPSWRLMNEIKEKWWIGIIVSVVLVAEIAVIVKFRKWHLSRSEQSDITGR